MGRTAQGRGVWGHLWTGHSLLHHLRFRQLLDGQLVQQFVHAGYEIGRRLLVLQESLFLHSLL
uniref:Uncharacterized protein n=1 Tax=Anguilla anguilla TaxID=7936 RepID=A0A0E9TBT6_ANGAN